MAHSNEFDIEGLIATASGTPGELGVDTVKVQLIKDYVAAYEKVYPSLKQHSKDFPAPKYLKSIIKCGNPHRGFESIGINQDTEATDFIINIIDKEDIRKVNICIWGGQTDVVQAIWKVRNSRSYEDYLKFISKIRIYDIMDQDFIFSYIKKEFPELFYILSKANEGEDKRNSVYRGMYLGGNEELTSKQWIEKNVLTDHGSLGELYPTKTWTAPNPHKAMKEGDTPSWFYFLPNGLQNPEYPSWGGWGGRYTNDTLNFFIDAKDSIDSEFNARSTIYRWRKYYQNEFTARMDWCVKSFIEANHTPEVVINGQKERMPITIEAISGEVVKLSADKSFDPDGDELEFYWWIYREAGTAKNYPQLNNNRLSEITFAIPENIKGQEIHLICEVTDKGSPALTRFKRIVIKINN